MMPAKALLVLRGGELVFSRLAGREFFTIMALLSEYEIEAAVATESMRPIRFRGALVRSALRFGDVSEKDYAGIIIPGAGADGDRIYERDPPAIIELLRSFNERKKAIAAQSIGVLALARAGILDGVKFAIEERYAPLVPLGLFQGAGVVVDGNIVTSGASPLNASQRGGVDSTAAMVRRFAAYVMTHM
ncbi:DJ-1/PfpI family protein [bacterium]|nr:DJ-1/PfpI family protein [bacterium]